MRLLADLPQDAAGLNGSFHCKKILEFLDNSRINAVKTSARHSGYQFKMQLTPRQAPNCSD